MTGPKDVSIKVGDVTLSTANVPKDGIDLNTQNKGTKNALSIFDKNNDGKLSAAEIKDAIVELESADKTRSEVNPNNEDQIITTKKNGKLEDVELGTVNIEHTEHTEKIKVEDLISLDNNTLDKIEKQLQEYSYSDLEKLGNRSLYIEGREILLDIIGDIRHLNKELPGEASENIKRLKSKIKDISSNDIDLQQVLNTLTKNSLQMKKVASTTQLKNGAKILQRTMVAENEIKKNGLQKTYNENWLKDSNGNHYRYNEQKMVFEKIANVEYVAKDGSYRTREKNEKGQQIVKTHNKANKNTIKVLNSENKTYINPEYAAKVVGLQPSSTELTCGGEHVSRIYYDVNENPYTWDKKELTFRELTW